ncbi:hypothetical protein [Streptomyces antarcticus]|uniref:hypothetical protein n=1 Tax=Streptomyces antarcticus TaxID=2996458 RepID=UPI00226E88D8|nr:MULTISPECIES: hypothetical protein [unclassified Streptomyces]MCY0942407.1 hypothetical protein [Streptomyces sp. H34-AA3]MCZ4080596.1 hypothetical protein [Streptomyces sp. H34-S5]
MGEQAHEHESVGLPGGPVDADGRAVDEPLLGALMGAAFAGCAPCIDRLLEEVADDPVTVGRLVVVSRQLALRVYRGELPGHMADDHERFGPAALEFKRLVRAVTAAEPVAEVCEQLTQAGRRAAARDAFETLTGLLAIADEEGLDPQPTLAELCCSVGERLLEWVFATAPLARREYSEVWRRWAYGRPEAGLRGTGVPALGLLLGAVLHRQARKDGVSAEQLEHLVLSRVLPALRDPEQAGAALATFAAPNTEGIAEITVPVKRLAAGDSDFLVELCRLAAHTVAMHVKDCPHGLREPEHECTLAHRNNDLADATQAHVATSSHAAGRRVALPTIGYHKDEITEDAPAGHDPDHVWQINVARILVERWDADAARWNEAISEDSSISEPNYQHETGLEALACPACGSREAFLAEGRWGDPLTLHCRCGVTIMSPSSAGPDDLGRLLLKRLILSAADPAYAARRLMPPLTEYNEREHRARGESWYRGPDTEDVALVEAIDLSNDDLVTALERALNPKLPQRHEGRTLTLLLLQVHDALSEPAVRDSGDGRTLADTVRTLVADLKQESDRWAHTRLLVVDRLKTWQAEGGPEALQDAWARTVEMADRHFPRHRVTTGRISDGCAGLALALYLLGSNMDTTVADVRLEDVRGLLAPGKAGSTPDPVDVPDRWEAQLRALGHNLDATDDPVARLWRHLRTEHTADSLGDRREPALTLGLDTILGERSFYRISL